MTRKQKLLLKLMEEANEVSQRASKQIQFGKDEIQDGQSFTNKQRLASEIEDFFVIIQMLEEEGELVKDDICFDEDNLKAKRAKVEKYLAYSDSLEGSK